MMCAGEYKLSLVSLQEQAGCKMVMIQDSQEVTGQSKPLRITGDPDKVIWVQSNSVTFSNQLMHFRLK